MNYYKTNTLKIGKYMIDLLKFVRLGFFSQNHEVYRFLQGMSRIMDLLGGTSVQALGLVLTATHVVTTVIPSLTLCVYLLLVHTTHCKKNLMNKVLTV